MTTYAKRVKNGIALLDEHYPGWDEHIDLDRLDISSPTRCICGQLERHGFFDEDWGVFKHAGNETGIIGSSADYELLTPEWKKAIKQRRKQRQKELVPA